jgi:hypothetical protein
LKADAMVARTASAPSNVVAHQFAPPQHDTYTAIHAEIDAALALLA